VDDDELILRSIERVLRRMASEAGWELCFASDADAALAELGRAPVEVVFVDANLGKSSGAALLREVQARDPAVVRILVSGQSGLDALRTALPYAHQFLPKPCEGELLRSTIQAACALRGLLMRPELRQLVGSSNNLPSAPRTFIELSTALASPNVNARAISDIVERDVAISARVLGLAGSAFYGLPRAVTSVGGAVAYLGVEVIKAIVLSVEVTRLFPMSQTVPDFSLERLHQHGLRVTQLARRLLGHDSGGDVLAVAGLLQDTGQIVMASRAASRFGIALSTSAARKRPLYEVELELFGATHADIGGYLLGLWGLPERVVSAVTHHLQPQRAGHRVFDAAAALHVANLLLADPDVPAVEQPDAHALSLDLSFLRLLGVAHQLDGWRKLARSLNPSRSERVRVAARA
jgi:HD-like signal output (HDOD) protein